MKRRVNLGCGARYHPDWTNIDIAPRGPGVMAHDLSQGIPLDDASCDVVYHSHVLEHIRRPEALGFMRECGRVLRPGGVLRVATPDLERLCRLYLDKIGPAAEGDATAASDHEWLMLEMYDQAVRERTGGAMLDYLARRPLPDEAFVLERIGVEGRELLDMLRRDGGVKRSSGLRGWRAALARLLLGADGARALEIGRFRLAGEVHQWMYDRHSLGALMRDAGVREPRVCTATESQVREWSGFHLDTLEDGTVVKPDSLFMEATR